MSARDTKTKEGFRFPSAEGRLVLLDHESSGLVVRLDPQGPVARRMDDALLRYITVRGDVVQPGLASRREILASLDEVSSLDGDSRD